MDSEKISTANRSR